MHRVQLAGTCAQPLGTEQGSAWGAAAMPSQLRREVPQADSFSVAKSLLPAICRLLCNLS